MLNGICAILTAIATAFAIDAAIGYYMARRA